VRRLFAFALALLPILVFGPARAGEPEPAPASRPAAAQASDPLAPISKEEWTDVKAAHLLRRACFGGTLDEVESLRKLGPEAAVERILSPAADPGPAFEPVLTGRPRLAAFRALDDAARRMQGMEYRRQDHEQIESLRAWWIERMIRGGRPLEEKMTLFWHGHFTSGQRDVKDSYHMYLQNETLRKNALGNFGTLLHAIAKDPAMLEYLDNQRNRKAAPNENFAREVMELFTLGIGNYTEKDIKEAARAFTGWGFEGNDFVFRRGQHDFGRKTILGRSGNFDGDEVLDILLEEPATARTIAAKLLRFFAFEDPSDAEVESLANTLRDSGYEVRPALRRLFLSRVFYSERAMGSQIKSPVELFVGLFRSLPFEVVPGRLIARACAQLGQELFEPPNVKGWPGGRDWISTTTLADRQAFVARVFGGEPEGRALGPQPPGARPVAPPGRPRGSRLLDLAGLARARGLDTPEKIVSFYERLLLVRPLSGEERRPILDALERDARGKLTPFRLDDPDARRRIEAGIRLLVAMPTFQLQ
jgi:uncharacterized protein (DUF1800 family)